MEISFTTKKESKHIQEEEFLKLTGNERMSHFLFLMKQMKSFPSAVSLEEEGNFVINFKNRI